MMRNIERDGGWTVLYDDGCGFCMRLLSILLRWDRAGRLHPVALQRSEAHDLLPDLTPTERMASWHLISPTGERHSGGHGGDGAPEVAARRPIAGGRTCAVSEAHRARVSVGGRPPLVALQVDPLEHAR